MRDPALLAKTLKPTLFERAMTRLAPTHATKSYKARVLMSLGNQFNFNIGQHDGARSESKMLRLFQRRAQSADEDNLGDLNTLRARSYDLQRNSPLASGALLTQRNMIIGTGLIPQPGIDHEFLGITPEETKKIQADLKRMWWLHAGCTAGMDVTERFNFAVLEAIAYSSMLLGGDVLMIRRWKERSYTPFRTCIQLVEAYRIRTPKDKITDANIRHGVQLGKDGEHVGYWVCNTDLTKGMHLDHSDNYTFIKSYAPSGERQAVLIQNPLRPNETRSAPYLSPAIESFRGWQEYMDNELLASLLNSMLTFFLENPAPNFDAGPGFGNLIDEEETEAQTGQSSEREISIGSGMLFEGKQGQKLGMYNPMRPNTSIGPFMEVLATSMAPALGMSKSFLLKKFEASYSASRAEGQETWRDIFPRRELFVNQMCQTAYGWWMGEVMMSEEQYFNVPDYFTDHFVREAWNYCEWPGPVPTSLDPLKEAEANKMAQEQGWVSNTRIAAQQYGTDFDVEQSQLAEEKKQRDKLGLTPEPPAPPKLPFGKGKGKDAEDETKTKDDASGAGDKDGES